MSTSLSSTIPISLLNLEAILDRWVVKEGNGATTQWLVHWANTIPSEAIWEFGHELQLQFPDFP